VAATREVKIMNQDSEWVLIFRGLNDGVIIILSKVEEGAKVQNND